MAQVISMSDLLTLLLRLELVGDADYHRHSIGQGSAIFICIYVYSLDKVVFSSCDLPSV